MASYAPPNQQQGSIFNPSDWESPNNGTTDVNYLNEHYCQYPVAQGNMSFAGISNTGSTTIKQNLVMTGIYNTNFIQFPDGTKQYTAVAGNDILNTSNTWTGVNTFRPNPKQVYGTTMIDGITLTNNQFNDKESDIVSYTPDSTSGLCIYSLSTYDNTLNKTPQIQLLPDGLGSIIQSLGSNGYVYLKATGVGGAIILDSTGGVKLGVYAKINFNNYANLTATNSSSGIISSTKLVAPSITSPTINFDGSGTLSSTSGVSGIVCDVDFKTSNLLVDTITLTNNGVDTGASIYPTSGGEIDMVCNQLNLSSTTVGTTVPITPQAGNLYVGTSITIPAQGAYNSIITYGNILSTQAFVQSAIQSQGSGDVSLSGNNPFTGINTFSNFCGTTGIQTYPQTSTNQFATIDYVNNLIPADSTVGLTPSSTIGTITVSPASPNTLNVLRISGSINFGTYSNCQITFTDNQTDGNRFQFLFQSLYGTPIYPQTGLSFSLYNPSTYTYFPLDGVQSPANYLIWLFNVSGSINAVNAGTYTLYANGYILLS